MRLIRFGEKSSEKPGLMICDNRKNVVQVMDDLGFSDFDHRFFENDGLAKLRDWLGHADANALPDVANEERWAAPIARPGKIICIGLNYADHARESGLPIPTEPIVFLKAPNTVVGPYDDVLIPRGSTKTDWEVELGVVVGRDARYLASAEDAENYIAGYCISHDVSERTFQLERGGQWTKGKSCDTFNPLGPWVATSDEISDVKNLAMSLNVDGTIRQHGNTKTMIFGVPQLVFYLSQFMTLEAGDVITTGTPPGVGLGMNPPVYLRAGSVVALSIDQLGVQRQRFRSA